MKKSDPMYRWRLKRATRAIEQVAEGEGRSFEEVYADIQELILEASQSKNSEERANFAKIPRVGALPTPEELIAYTVMLYQEQRGK